jgi:hypothetical protein
MKIVLEKGLLWRKKKGRGTNKHPVFGTYRGGGWATICRESARGSKH